MKKIGVGLIGWGFMGRMHTYALRAIPLMYPGIDFTPVLSCVCSRRIEMAREAAQTAGYREYTDDYRALLAREDVEVVSICTPNKLHEEMAIAALAAGKHVYIDKPLAVTPESANRIALAARNAPGKTQMVMNNRFFPATLRAKSLVEEGGIGDVTGFSARYLHSGSVDENKPIGWKQETQGGVILDLASHALDLITWLIGEPKRVFCAVNTLYSSRPRKGGGVETALAEDHALMTLQMPGGALGTIEASKVATGENDELSFAVYGKKGALKFDLMSPEWLWYFDNTAPETSLGGTRGFTRIECVGRYDKPAGVFPPPKNAVGWDRGHIHCYYSFWTAWRTTKSRFATSPSARVSSRFCTRRPFPRGKAAGWIYKAIAKGLAEHVFRTPERSLISPATGPTRHARQRRRVA